MHQNKQINKRKHESMQVESRILEKIFAEVKYAQAQEKEKTVILATSLVIITHIHLY